MNHTTPSPERILVKPQLFKCPDPLDMKCGKRLESFELIYETYGQLNEKRDNACLICHALSGHHHAAGYHHSDDKRPGWWDNMIGSGKPIDTDRWFVVCPNNLGGCHGSTGPTHINPSTGQLFGPDFPMVTVQDWVVSQHRLMEHLGLRRWAAVIGGSLGGMQALQWVIDYPDCLNNAIIIAASTSLSAQNIAFNEIARRAIMNDPEFHSGRYDQSKTMPKNGLSIARMLGHVSYLSSDSMEARFGRERKDNNSFSLEPEFSIESYLQHQSTRFVDLFDANTYLLMTRALDYYDPSDGRDLSEVFQANGPRCLVISFSADWRFSPRHSERIVNALVKARQNVSYVEVASQWGHDDFLLANQEYFDALAAFINRA